MKKNVEQVCTAIIKTFKRPDKLIKLLDSIRCYYPNLPVIIVDDSKEPIQYAWDPHTEYHHVSYDIGASAGRNLAVSYVKTPYTLNLDDDLFFVKETKIEKFLSVLEESDFDLVGGRLFDHGERIYIFSGFFEVRNKILYVKDANKGRYENGYPRFDFVDQFFLAKTDLLRACPRYEDIKTRDHEIFFWQLKQRDACITYTSEVCVHHFPENKKGKNEYCKMRYGRVNHFSGLVCKKIGVNHIIYDSVRFNGPLGLFKVYLVWKAWALDNHEKNILAKIYLKVVLPCRPILFTKLFYKRWRVYQWGRQCKRYQQ